MKPINLRIAEELGVREQQVAAAISLLDGGATVPFVARYRKEVTEALDDAQLRMLDERLRYLRELDERRAAILDSITQQGKLGAALKQAIDAADSKARLDEFLPNHIGVAGTLAETLCHPLLKPSQPPRATPAAIGYPAALGQISANRHMAAPQLARDPSDTPPQRLQPQHRCDLLRRLHRLSPR
jgi:protein Tex